MSADSELKTVGEQLREAREAKGWTIEEAARRTKLPKINLERLEENQFEFFPSLSNARGFVRIYARELELNGWDLLRKFEGGTEIAAEAYDLRPEDLQAIPHRRQPLRIKPPKISIVFFALVLLIALGVGGVRLYQIWPSLVGEDSTALTQEATPEVAEPPANPVDLAPALPAQPSKPADNAPPKAVPVTPVAEPAIPRATPVAQAAVPAAEAIAVETNHTLQLRAARSARSHQRWVRVIAINNGQQQVLFQDLLPAGELVPQSPWKADQFVIKFGEASKVDIIYDGTNEGTYERPGVQTVRLPIEP
ncbi:MAG: helix-turn-helix domain-containing protein [Verrucomicrobiota bacterium]